MFCINHFYSYIYPGTYHIFVRAHTKYMSFGVMETRLWCIAANCVFCMTSTKKYSHAWCSARMDVAVNWRSILKSWAISCTSHANGSFWIKSMLACVLWKYLICRSAKLPDLKDLAHWGFRVGCVVLSHASFHFLACATETCLPETMLKICIALFWPILGEK